MVSVIVPVYNAEKTLPACVQSILNQSYTDYELILIDDGSKDRSGQICDELRETCAERSIRCQVIHQENGGVSRARNCGMEHANGEYFVCVDSDDLIEPCYLEDLVRTAETHPELGHVLCGFRCTSHVHDYVFSQQEELSVLDRSDYMHLFEKILVQGPCFALYRTGIVRRQKIRMREDMSRAEDILFNLDYLDALDRTAIGVVNKPNYIYQDEDSNSLYRKYRDNLAAINDVVNETIASCLKKWHVTDEASWKKYYDAVLCNYQTVISNTFHRRNSTSIRQKINANNAILREALFQEALQKSSIALLPALKKAYESGDYRKVLAVEFIQRIKHVISDRLRGKKEHSGDKE